MNPIDSRRRALIQAIGSAGVGAMLPATAMAAIRGRPLGRVVVVGGGFAGATAAKYLRKWGEGRIEVILIEREREFISCPASNEVLAGYREFDSLRQGHQALTMTWGVKLVHASVTAIDAEKRRVRTDAAGEFSYDRLVIAPGFDFIPDQVAGYDAAAAAKILHAWKAGAQTVALRKQLAAMPDGGVYVLSIPKAPYRCPPGPYERASLIASYFKAQKPKSKVIILDANDKVQSKEKLFRGVWGADYKDILDYQPNWNAVAIDAATNTVISEFGDRQRADVLNVVPPQRAGDIARVAGVVNINDRWADVEWISLESTAVPGIHVIGDALSAALAMPKSGHMANQHGKAVAAALVEMFAGRSPVPTLLANTCYSLVDDRRGIHVASVHRYDAEKKQPIPVVGAGGVSAEPSVTEGLFARAWATTIWQDVFS